MSLRCRNCGLLWPGDEVLTLDDLAKKHAEWLPMKAGAIECDRNTMVEHLRRIRASGVFQLEAAR